MQTIFFVSTGRCGTKFLSESIVRPDTLVVHELEQPSAHRVMNELYVPLAKTASQSLGDKITREYKLPHLKQVLADAGKSDFIDTGHQFNFGLFPHLIDQLSNIKIVRLRRDRFDTATSFMATEPKFDIWNVKPGSTYYRWMLSPYFKICETPSGILYHWHKLSRFQKILWAIDEVERAWQKLLKNYRYAFLEFNFSQIESSNYSELEKFLSAKIVVKEDPKSRNSSEYRNRKKPFIPQERMLAEDGKLQELYIRYY